MRNVNQFKLEPLRKRRDFYLSQQYRRPTMSEPFLQLWMMSAIDIFGISDERRLVRNRLPPKAEYRSNICRWQTAKKSIYGVFDKIQFRTASVPIS